MLSKRYMTMTKNLPAILAKIQDGAAPSKFTVSHLKGLGFTSSNDLTIIPVLKDLQFLSADGTPLERYHAYRNKSQAAEVLGNALRDAYTDIFHINENPSEADKAAIHGKFKSTHNVTDQIAKLQTSTFLALLKLADLKKAEKPVVEAPEAEKKTATKGDGAQHSPKLGGFHYNIEIHLPATKEPEVFNAIFKSLKEHLLG